MSRARQMIIILLFSLMSACGGGGGESDSEAGGGYGTDEPTPVINTPPEVDAGSDQTVTAGQSVILAGSGSDGDGTVIDYQWTQLSGSAIDLTNADQAVASFTAPSVLSFENLEFSLTITDDAGEMVSDRVTITVNPQQLAALPDYGPDLDLCPATLSDRGDRVIHLCDCQSGAVTDCTPGDDANLGSALSPKRSIMAAIAAFNAGSDLAFCRGGVWHSDTALQLSASGCRSGTPCTLQDYGDSVQARPTIRITQAGNVDGMVFDPSDDQLSWQGIQIHNLQLSKQSRDGEGFGLFLFRNLNQVVMQCLEVDGFGIGVYLNSNDLESGDITLSDSHIHDNGVMGWLGGTHRTRLERNRFHNNGWLNASALQHNVYLSQMKSDGVVRGNWLSDSALDMNDQCVGTSLVAHNDNTVDLLIENNLIEERNPSPGCWGLTVDAAGSTTESHQRAVIRGNLVRNVGNLAIGVASCVDCIIENNIVVQTLIGGATGIASPNRSTAAPDLDVSGTVVRNNSVYFGGAASGRAYYVGERGGDYVVTNNIGYFANPQSGDSCYDFDLSADAYQLVNSNLCFGASFDSGTSGLDGMASSADPGFLDAPDDLRLESDSAARDRGTTLSVPTTDMLGNPRDATPDLGAYETP
ncbi:MAG: right-handed parallel beta-helix repeat-containing protein [Candidatus Thiodiazotropha weberae]|nr:right-handed parallel beta-helix repeat-containing protein [Candidatus Thiodiazotropha weberae]